MKNFNQDDRRGQKYQAVCSDCGKTCEVPFQPTGDRPIYCQACFEKRGKIGGGREDKKMYQAVCAKCGKKCEVPFRPSGDKPVYCNDCFGKHGNAPAREKNAAPGGNQFEIINSKLDRILAALNQGGSVSAAPKIAAAAEKVKGNPVKAKAAVKKSAVKKKKK